ncbi:MAG: alginate export family protein [Thermonemataceae bacterium]
MKATRRISLWSFLVGIFLPTALVAQTENSPYVFKMLRQEDVVKSAQEETTKTLYKTLKYIPFRQEGYASFGGSYRTQFEFFDSQNFELGATDGWWLNRLMLHGHFRFGKKWQLFGEMVSSTIQSKTNLSPVDLDELAVNQAFIRYDNGPFTLLLGRENLRYGSQRIIAPREGPNVRRSFDGARAICHRAGLKLEFLYYEPVDINPFLFDNETLNGNESILGTYNPFSSSTGQHNLDFYYIVQQRNEASYEVATALEERHSLGLRYFGRSGPFSFDHEGLYQFGHFGTHRISAWTLSTKLYYFVSSSIGALDVELKSEIISGDRDPDDAVLNTFNALYPRGAYFGRVAQFGPANLIDIHPSLTLTLKKWFFTVDYLAIWRASVADAVYGAGLDPAFSDTNDAAFIGHQLGGIVNWEVNSFLALEIESNYILPGSFLRASDLNNSLLHVVATAELKF